MFGRGIFGLILAFLPSVAHAQDYMSRDPVFSFDGFVGTSNEVFQSPDGSFILDQVVGLESKLSARYEWRNDMGDQIFFEPSITGKTLPSERQLDRLRLGLFTEYRHRLQKDRDVQLQFRAGVEHSNDYAEAKFNRLTLGTNLVARLSEQHNALFSLRYRYRDQNDAETFPGADQRQFFVSAQHIWKPKIKNFTQVLTTVSAEVRKADEERYGYTEVAGKLQVVHEPLENLQFIGRMKMLSTDYHGDFSPAFDFARSDQRLWADVEARYKLGDNQQIYASFGWERNNSNIPIREFSGPTFKFGFKNTWR